MRLALALAAAALLAACHSVKKPGGELILRLDPPELAAGTLITVTASPAPKAELAWVSGTVKVMGAAVMPFRQDPLDGQWKFKTMVPAFVTIPSGTYEARAWGMSKNGEKYEGSMKLEVK